MPRMIGTGKTTVARWNAVWANTTHLWQWSSREMAEAYADKEDCMVYVVEVTAEGYRPFWGTTKSTAIFEELTKDATAS